MINVTTACIVHESSVPLALINLRNTLKYGKASARLQALVTLVYAKIVCCGMDQLEVPYPKGPICLPECSHLFLIVKL